MKLAKVTLGRRKETWTGAAPQLLAAYELKERFYGFWDATTRPQAEVALDD